jgi:beta-lactam-binding protein with PASTA domain
VVIPSVRGRPESEAYATLRAAGFDIQTKRRSDDAVASGIALGTNPGDGAILGSGSSVELLISQGH